MRALDLTILLVALLHATLAAGVSPSDALAPRPFAARVYPLAARYVPGSEVTIGVEALSPNSDPLVGSIELIIFHLHDEVYRAKSESVTLRPDTPTSVQFKWTAPQTDFTGYLAVISAGGAVIGTTGIDISSTPLGYPRYGYLSNFSPDQTQDALDPIVQRLAQDYHLNLFQFYDWAWRHEKLIQRENDIVQPLWQDLFDRTNSVQVIHDLLDDVHRYNALGMAYAMIYAAREGYAERWPIQPSWGLFAQPHAVDQLSFDFSPLRPGAELFLFDPSNPNWQQWMTSEYVDAINTFGFDGIHIDQLGPREEVSRVDGTPVHLPDTFGSFLRATDQRLSANNPARAACTFNIVDGTVDGWAVREVAGSEACDFLYSEIWFKTNTYAELRRYVEQLRTMGRGRPVVLAAYAQYGEQTGPTYEAEGQTALKGAGISSNVPGFTGFGFVDSLDNAGDSVTWTFDLPSASTESIVFSYANASGFNVKGNVDVNGQSVRQISFPSRAQWNAWQTSFHVEGSLVAGKNAVTLTVAEETDGAIVIDHMRLSEFDEDAVRLELASIYASGATSIIVGDDQQSLGAEYYPNRSKGVPPPLKRAIRDDLSFITAYETLLFPPEVKSLGDGTSRLVAQTGQRLIDQGANGIWVVPRRIGPYDMLHLINLVSVDDLWRNSSDTPPVQTNIGLRYYVGDDVINGVFLASPDFNFSRTTPLSFERGQDERGRFVEFRVPRLVYWDMLYFQRAE